MSETKTLPDKIVCDGYGIGEVKSEYIGNIRGYDETFVTIYFAAIKMTYSLPLEKLIYRKLSTPNAIKNFFKQNISDKVTTLSKVNFNVQQIRMQEMIKTGALEDVVFLLRYLDCKKKSSPTKNDLCAYDDNLYRKIMNNLAEEMSVLSNQTMPQSIDELKKIMDKNPVHVYIENTEYPSEMIKELNDFTSDISELDDLN